jgi:hypothetical protein
MLAAGHDVTNYDRSNFGFRVMMYHRADDKIKTFQMDKEAGVFHRLPYLSYNSTSYE